MILQMNQQYSPQFVPVSPVILSAGRKGKGQKSQGIFTKLADILPLEKVD
jgi:hypothetical protein